MLRAAAKWHTLSESQVSWTHDQIRALCSVFSPLGWRVHADGVEGPNDHRWSFSSPPDHLGASLHKLRTSWRMACMRRWRAAKRIDAQLARNQGLMLSEEVLDKVRSIASGANSHLVAILTGGMSTQAVVEKFHQRNPRTPQQCMHCMQTQVPSMHHILWSCSRFNHLRLHPTPPSCPLMARIGWGEAIAPLPLLHQMASIRAAEAALREKERRGRGGGQVGGGLPPED